MAKIAHFITMFNFCYNHSHFLLEAKYLLLSEISNCFEKIDK